MIDQKQELYKLWSCLTCHIPYLEIYQQTYEVILEAGMYIDIISSEFLAKKRSSYAAQSKKYI